MKLTSPETIQESEKDFIDTINAELDWEAIEKMLLEKHSFTLQEEIDYKKGDLVVHNDDIAYKFDFEIKVPLSVIFNREGDCLDISTVREDFEEDIEEIDDLESLDDMQDLDDVQKLDDIQDLNELVQDGSTTKKEPDAKSTPIPEDQGNKVAQMASNIADMISEINQGDE